MLLEYICKKRKPIILSTGLSNFDDVVDTVDNNTNNLETGTEDDTNNQVDTDSNNESCADITGTYLPKRPPKKFCYVQL